MIVSDYDRFVKEGEARRAAQLSGRPAPAPLPSLSYGYPGGSYNDITTGGSKYAYGISGTGSSTTIDHAVMRQNSRTAVQESLQARGIVERFTDITVSTGLLLEPTPATEVLGITPEQGETWSEDVARRFHLWAGDRRSSRDESMTFYQQQRFAGFSMFRDNDYFVRMFYSRDRRLQNPLQLQFVDPDLIKGDALTSSTGLHLECDGIKYDAAGRETGYQVHTKMQDEWRLVNIPAVGRGGRRMMLHGYQAEYAGQRRGFSKIGHALQEFQKIGDFTLAQVQKAIMQSTLSWYVKPSADAPASNPFEEGTSQYTAGVAATMYGSQPTGVAQETHVDYCDLPTASFRRPGSVGVYTLQGGEDLKGFADHAPSENFDRFVDSFTAYLSSSASMPIEVLLMRFGQNYSASRATLLLFWQVAEIMRAELESDFLNIVYEAWLSEEIAAGRIAAPGFFDPRLRQAWLASNWIGEPVPNIDPRVTAEANKVNLEMGATTLDRVARENKSNGKANRAKLAREYSELPSPPWLPTPGAEQTEPDDENEDDNG
jgi:capsid protein